MNKKAETKAQTADEDANLDEALDESFPASDPPSMTQPRTGADMTQRKPKRPPKGEAIHRRQGGAARAGVNRFVTTVNHPRLVKTRFFSKLLELDKLRCGRDNPLAADWRPRARIPISAVLLSHMRASRDRIRVKLITGLLVG